MASVRRTSQELIDWLAARQLDWSTREFDRETVIAVRRALIGAAARGQMSDFNAAEQLYLALESLSYTLGDRQRLKGALDRIYTEVEDGAKFNPSSLASTAQKLQGKF